MLNELKQITDNISGEKSKGLHFLIANLPSSGLLRVKCYVKEDGSLIVEKIDDETFNNSKYVYKDNGNQYPYIKIDPSKILSVDLNDKDCVNNILVNMEIPEIKYKKIKATKNKIVRYGNELVSILERNIKTESIFLLQDRFSKIKDFGEFLSNLFKETLKLFPLESEIKGTVLRGAFFNGIYVDFEPYIEKYGSIKEITTPEVMLYLSDFFKQHDKNTVKNSGGNKSDVFGDSYSGKHSEILPKLKIDDKYLFSLYSRNKEAGCNSSYNKSGLEMFPISPKNEKDLVSKIKYLVSHQNKDLFWHKFLNADKDKKYNDIIIVYSKMDPSVLKEINKNLILEEMGMLSEEETDESIICEMNSKNFISLLKGERIHNINDMKDIFILIARIPQNGPTILKMSENFSFDKFLSRAEKWIDGFDNYENTKIFLKNKDKFEEKHMASSITLEKMKRVLNKRWGRKNSPIKSINSTSLLYDFFYMTDMFNLFMGDIDTINSVIKILSSHHVYLMIDVANRLINRSDYDLFSYRNDVFYLPVVFSEILSLSGISKNEYEKSTPYLMGKLFASISNLERSYILDIMGKKKCSQRLSGEKYVQLALENPKVALHNILIDSAYYTVNSNILNKTENIKKTQNKDKSIFYYNVGKTAGELIDREIPRSWKNIEKMLFGFGYFQNR